MITQKSKRTTIMNTFSCRILVNEQWRQLAGEEFMLAQNTRRLLLIHLGLCCVAPLSSEASEARVMAGIGV